MFHSGHTPNPNYQNLFSNHEKRDTDTKSTVRDLEARLNKLEMVCEAMWLLLKKETDLSDEALITEVTNIDLSDGFYDGKKKTVNFKACKKCDRNNNKNRTQCLYCGDLFIVEPFNS